MEFSHSILEVLLEMLLGFYLLYKILYSFGERQIEKTGCVEISWDNAAIDEIRIEKSKNI